MKIKVSEASGVVLDWMVAAAPKALPEFYMKDFKNLHDEGRFHFSTDWAQGGPIIERECIDLHHQRHGDLSVSWVATWDSWESEHTGPTPLIAAMRCYVVSKLGDEVEVPDALL